MSLAIAVVGASGVYGRHLVPRLIERRHRVRALVRRPASGVILGHCGADIRIADIFDGDALRSAFAGCDVVVNLATTIPRPGQLRDFTLNDRIRREGTAVIVASCRSAGVDRLVQQSIAMIHAGAGSSWIAESSPLRPTAATESAIDMEAMVIASDREWIILRGGLFYGPGTGREDDWFKRATQGTLKVPGDGTDFVSLVHVADMADATVLALERAPSRCSFLVCDDQPSPWGDVLTWAALLAGAREPPRGGPSNLPSFRVSNRSICEWLNWSPRYPSFRTGLAR